jgi:hypothetical protein
MLRTIDENTFVRQFHAWLLAKQYPKSSTTWYITEISKKEKKENHIYGRRNNKTILLPNMMT